MSVGKCLVCCIALMRVNYCQSAVNQRGFNGVLMGIKRGLAAEKLILH